MEKAILVKLLLISPNVCIISFGLKISDLLFKKKEKANQLLYRGGGKVLHKSGKLKYQVWVSQGVDVL